MIRLQPQDGGGKMKTKRVFTTGLSNKVQQATSNGSEMETDIVYLDGRLTVLGVNELGKLLLKAALEGDVEETRSLLNKGALFTADWLGTSPLHLAAKHNHVEICEILLRAGISKDARTKVDKTPLHLAANEGSIEVCETLLAYGADPNCRDLLGMTPLHWAVQNGFDVVVQCLLKHGAITDCPNKFGLRPIDIAMQINRSDIVEIIEMGNCDEPLLAAENLAHSLELSENANDEFHNETFINVDPACDDNESGIPLETILSEDTNDSIISDNNPPDNLADEDRNITSEDFNNKHQQQQQQEQSQNHIAESIKLLKQHGITMLPNEENNILTTVIKTGHSVVLTDVGKEMLNSVKETEHKTKIENKKKFLTLTSDEFLQLTTNGSLSKGNILKQINGKLVPKNIKRIIMKKNNKLVSPSTISTTTNTNTTTASSNRANHDKSINTASMDIETIMSQLIEARRTIEEMKIKLIKKEQEAEKYKQQLNKLLEDR